MSAPTSAAAVANAFLEFQEAESGTCPPIDQMKLQKLVYYAHAWWLAHAGEPLFDEDIEAWPWGPVVRNLYIEFKDHGSRPIVNDKATELIKRSDRDGDFIVDYPPNPPADILEFLRSVWDAHKGFTGVQLSNVTHAPGEPWTIMLERYKSLEDKPSIPNTLIRDVFRKKLAEQPA